MIIKLNDNDIHGAIRSLLRERSIIDNNTEIETTITVGRGKNSGVTAEVVILETNLESNLLKLKTSDAVVKPTSALFTDDEVSKES